MKYLHFKGLLSAFLSISLLLSFFSAPGQGKFDENLIEILEIRSGMIVADVGAGRGKFTILLAREVGPEGHVYANEIKSHLIDRINQRKNAGGFKNITTILGHQKDPLLPVQMDLVLLKFVYHHLAHPHEFMVQIRKYLKPGGRLAVVAGDINSRARYREGKKPEDPCISDPNQTKREIEGAGFVFIKKGGLEGRRVLNYVLIFKAPN
jgi:ubiquinone/menaquinone biosynthesis C-methylase UbiE